jgi:hypothetical protein
MMPVSPRYHWSMSPWAATGMPYFSRSRYAPPP